ncbi:hypothetical protein NS334_08570 [Sphingomonas endophytica]|uniref:Uncharacterized protein n=1 Tax=Sphingomonas endophytica TaxID=869719 RepID=A0A147I3E9_9SPHN|nr:hypothetical protein NS334_08570 [Sphingomonas endophytica]
MTPRVSREDAHRAIGASLRRHLRRKGWTVKRLANASGVPDKAIECAKYDVASEHWRPIHKAEWLLSIAAVLGADFTSPVLAVAQQGAFDITPDIAPRPGEIVATMAGHTAEMAAILVDGIVDDEERPRVIAIATSKATHVAAILRLAQPP